MVARQDTAASSKEQGDAKSLTCLQVKNTFIHAETPKAESALRRSSSSPAFSQELSGDDADDNAEHAPHGASDEDGKTFAAEEIPLPSPEEKLRAHLDGNCRPCRYFHFKSDGCRLGDACEFCHLCTEEAAKQYQRSLKKSSQRGKSRAPADATSSKTIFPVPMRAVCSFAARRSSKSQACKADVEALVQSFFGSGEPVLSQDM
eukprot:TRINITY_DN4380_c0_g1_i1.p1 TRINITY_DN4380_c0_g1~~TRINITY_DN4380_c0_g1_i1.p1  ORF type:complete len:223 (-),score=38.98 TRINITY_DN4380_c0_g1_i1:292-903(-)